VQIGRAAEPQVLDSLARGVEMPNGERLKARRAGLVRSGERNSWIEIVLDEGKNRQIRRMLDALGVEVLRLVRVAIGPLELGELRKGAHRSLRQEEKEALDQAIRASSSLGSLP
jgi:23S rRNA pseudouridine2605 synthase